jgi:dihydropyrimidinase
MDLLIRNGTALLEHDVRQADIAVTDGKIAVVAPHIDPDMQKTGERVIDAKGLLVFPGFIDAHTHYGIPGSADDFYSGTRAAAFGGITSVIDFSDQLTGEPLINGVKKRIKEAEGSALDFALHQGIYRLHTGIETEIEELAAQGITTLKMFSTYKEMGLMLEKAYWEKLFSICAEHKMLVTIHAEDDAIIQAAAERYKNLGLRAVQHGLIRPDEAEYQAILEAGEAARNANTPLYVVHLSSKRGLEAVRRLRRSGAVICVETTGHYLFLDHSCMEGKDGPLFLMNPPLRGKTDNAALLEALRNREIAVVATDHCSFSPEQKTGAKHYPDIPAGIPGSEELSSMLYTYGLDSGNRDLLLMKELLSENPARTFGLYPQKGVLKAGSDADITLFSPSTERTLSSSHMHSKAGYSVYNGFKTTGAPVMTIANGEVLVEDGKWYGSKGRGCIISAGVSSCFDEL